MNGFDVIVIGGGMVGPAIAYGLVCQGLRVAVLDEGDTALRAARGNFGLVWFQGKGLGMPRYVAWTRESTELWPAFHAELDEATGVDTGYRKTGGLDLCVGEDELAKRQWHVGQLRQQGGDAGYDCEFLDRGAVQDMIGSAVLGDEVVGASFSPHDGHANPLRLMRALHTGFTARGGRLLTNHRVIGIERVHGVFRVRSERGTLEAPKVVLAAGHGINALAPMVGLGVRVAPERGQVLVTERVQPMLAHAMSRIRQTDEGTVMIGDSHEDVGYDAGTTADVTAKLARHAVRAIPALARARMVRTWGALRIHTPDKFPVYEESMTHPGAYVAVTHSGVTLAAMHAHRVAPWIAGGPPPADFAAFSSARFDVPPHAAG